MPGVVESRRLLCTSSSGRSTMVRTTLPRGVQISVLVGNASIPTWYEYGRWVTRTIRYSPLGDAVGWAYTPGVPSLVTVPSRPMAATCDVNW